MVDAGIARRVDFGDGKFRFEHSYRHPRHFHLICKACQQSFEFLSSDIEALIEEVATARRFLPAESLHSDLRHVRRVPGRASRPPGPPCRSRPCLRATRCAWPSRPNAAAWRSTRRAARLAQRRPRPAGVREARGEEKEHLATLEGALPGTAGGRTDPRCATAVSVLQECVERFVCRRCRRTRGARRGRPAGAADRYSLRARIPPVLQTVWRPVRGVGRQADLSRVRRRGARPLRVCSCASSARSSRASATRPHAGLRPATGTADPVIDLHLHTTASDGRSTPEALVDDVFGGGCRTIARHRPRHGGRSGGHARGSRGSAVYSSSMGSRSRPSPAERDVHILGYFIDPSAPRLARFSGPAA